MKTIDQHIPIFEENQVLTAGHLNELRAYLDRQDSLTRSHLIGIGIVCGLELSYKEDGTLIISEGVGITSKGYLITLPDTTCTHLHKYQDKKTTLEDDEEGDQHADFYDPFMTGEEESTQIGLWELLTEEEEDPYEKTASVDWKNGTVYYGEQINFSDYYVLLYLQVEDVDTDDCCGDDCDEEGIRREFSVKKLLIHKNHLSRVIARNKEDSLWPSALHTCAVQQDLCMERFGYYDPDRFVLLAAEQDETEEMEDRERLRAIAPNLSLQHYVRYSDFEEDYISIIKHASIRVEKALAGAYDAYKPLLKKRYPQLPFEGFSMEAEKEFGQNTLFIYIKNKFRGDNYGVQYAYDFLIDLIDGYHEFRDSACEVMAVCRPDTSLFKQHLLLGAATPIADGRRPVNRHYFIPSPIHSNHKDKRQKALMLFERLVEMVDAFQGNPDVSDIRITPDKTSAEALSHRSIPFYYDVESRLELVKNWNYANTRLYKWNQVPSYHAGVYNKGENGHRCTVEALFHSNREYSHYRVEGHIGKNYENALTSIEGQRKDYNLPFKVVGVKLSDNSNNTELSVECHFEHLENMYQVHRSELECLLDEELAFFNKLDSQNDFVGIAAVWFRKSPEDYCIDALSAVKSKLAEKLEELNIQELEQTYNSLIQTFENYKNSIKQKEGRERETNKQTILFWVNRMINNCSMSQFKRIYGLYEDRIREMKEMNLFSNFAERHSGMEHMAGVPRGGTLVLVYIDRNGIDINRVSEPARRTEEANYQLYEVLMETKRAEKEKYRAKYSRSEKEKMKKEIAKIFDKIAAEKKEEERKLIKEVEKGFAKEITIEQDPYVVQLPPDHVVVADFALPYLCRGDCPELNTMVISQISFSLSNDRFCGDDDTRYKFVTQPAGGKVISSGGGVTKEGNTWYFQPSAANVEGEEISFTYQVNNQTVVFNASVLNPLARFEYEVKQQEDGGVEVKFLNDSERAREYQWDFGDNKQSTEANPVHVYKDYDQSSVTVVLTASKLGCTSEASKSVKLPVIEETEFDLRKRKGADNYTYCSSDEHSYPFTTKPAGDLITGDDVSGVTQENGKYFFEPEGYAPGDYIFKYKGKELEVHILRGPTEVGFDWDVIEDGKILRISYTGPIEGNNWSWQLTYLDNNSSEHLDNSEKVIDRNSKIVGSHVLVELTVTSKDGCSKKVTEEIKDPFNWEQPDTSDDIRVEVENRVNNIDTYYNPDMDDNLFGGENILLNRAKTYLTDLKGELNDEAKLKKYKEGEMNLDIAKKFKTMLSDTAETVKTKAEGADKAEKDYLAGIYNEQLEQLLELAAKQKKDIRANSKMGQLLKSIREQVKTLRKAGLQIDPKKTLSKTIVKAKAEAENTNMNNFNDLLKNLEDTIINIDRPN